MGEYLGDTVIINNINVNDCDGCDTNRCDYRQYRYDKRNDKIF